MPPTAASQARPCTCIRNAAASDTAANSVRSMALTSGLNSRNRRVASTISGKPMISAAAPSEMARTRSPRAAARSDVTSHASA